MSKPRELWWSYVKGMIRAYHSRQAEQQSLQAPTLTANYNGLPKGSGGHSRPTEALLERGLSGTALAEYEAVKQAISATERYSNGRDRLLIIRLVYWDRSHTLAGAALQVPCSIETAKRWNGDFIRGVATSYGLLKR